MLATFGTRDETVAGADMAMAAKVEHVIHNADGTQRMQKPRQRPVPAERRNSGPPG